MVKSMTGFGKANCEFQNKKITVEVKSLNSKQFDWNGKLPNVYKEKELEIRAIANRLLERGKVELYISIENTTIAKTYVINKDLIKSYFAEVKELSYELGVTKTDELLSVILKFPEALISEKDDLVEDEWETIIKTIEDAILSVDFFRKNEGAILAEDFKQRISLILGHLATIETFEKERLEIIKERILSGLSKILDENKIDKNRMEQELIYYIEKIDFTEEKVRLRKHCDYFIDTMNEPSSGKKLGFVCQEIGREINTLGSKANDADIQQIVVQMKDELEKIKEQLMNIL
ncbi:MAG: YicC family protein [Bacteroidetes bacterium]|nr:YicC family protein [Bacteroidota bacterium]